MTDLTDAVTEIARGEHRVGRGIGYGIICQQLAHALIYAIGMAPTKFRSEPAFFGCSGDRRDSSFLQEPEPIDDSCPLLLRPPGNGTQNDETLDTTGIGEGQRLSDEAAEREAGEMRAVKFDMAPDETHIVRKIVKTAVACDGAGLAVAGKIHADDAVVRPHFGCDLVPGVEVCADPVNQGDKRAVALNTIVNFGSA